MIKFEKLVKSFTGRVVLKGISFEVHEGEILFILGTSGTGKSVLLKNIVGLMSPDSGSIILDGEEISKLNENEYLRIRKKCGMVFQHPALFDSLTVFENVAFGLRRSNMNLTEEQIREKVNRSLESVQIYDDYHKKPAEISYGTQKRVSLARTIALDPKILLFDEPTTGLDPVTTFAINKLIKDLSRKMNTTSIVVSHDMTCALDIADKIIVLDGGQIVDQGTPSELKKSKVPLVRDFLEEVLNA